MTPYYQNVGRFIEDHPGWVVSAGPGGFGYSVQARGPRGRARGPVHSALTLDQLADIAAREDRAAGLSVPLAGARG